MFRNRIFVTTGATLAACAGLTFGSLMPAHADPAGYYEYIDQSLIEAVSASSEELTAEGATNGRIAASIDGNDSTFWHSKWSPSADPAPHTLIYKLAGDPAEDIDAVVLGIRGGSSGSGRVKDYAVSIARAADADCSDPDLAWDQTVEGSVAAEFRNDTIVRFDKGAVKCIKVVYKMAWSGTNQPADASSLAEFNLAKFIEGTKPLGDPPGPTALADRPLPAGTISSADVLNSLAADDRRADNADKTPIALKIPSADGDDRIVGARQSDTPAVASLDNTNGNNYFIDCLAENSSNEGTQENPWTSVAKINEHGDFMAHDQILFKRGTECIGLVHPHGSGNGKDATITIDAYGNPDDPLPKIHGAGMVESPDNEIPNHLKNDGKGVESAVIRFYNQEWWTVRNLELTNYSGDRNDWKVRRRGVVVALEDFGRGKGFEISDLFIHDVLGRPDKDLGGSGGIQFEAYAGPKTIPTSFEQLHVHHNQIRHVSRSGINEGSRFRSRPSVGPSINDNPFEVWGPMDVHDNILSDIGGDAIVTQFASKSKVYNNTVWNFANHHGGKASAGNNAGIWPWDADHVHYYNNHVFDGVMPDGTWDSTAFDADYGTTGTLFEYNVTHDNAGGFMLFCGCGGLSTKTVMRYNISINDGRGGESHAQGPRVFFIAGQTDAEVYNNTFVTYPNAHVDKGSANNAAVVWANNVFMAQGPVKTTWNNFPKNLPWRNNLFTGTDGNWPSADTNTVKADVKVPQEEGLAALRPAQELIVGKGVPIFKHSEFIERPVDFEDISRTTIAHANAPDLGAFQSEPKEARPHVMNGGFEDEGSASGWTLTGDAKVSGDVHRGGFNALTLAGASDTAKQDVPVAVNGTYRLVAAVKATDGGDFPTITLTNPAGVSVVAHTEEAGPADPNGWQPVTALMRTAWDASDLTITVSGPGSVDDISLELVNDYMVDGSFQSRSNTPWTAWNTGREDSDAVSGELALKVNGVGSSENPETVVPEVSSSYELTGFAKVVEGDTVQMGVKGYDKDNTGEQMIATFSAADTNGKFAQKSLTFTPTKERFTVYCYMPKAGKAVCDDFMLTRTWDGTVPEIAGAMVAHTITVTNGTADVEQQVAGETVTVTASEMAGMEFVGWEASPEVEFADASATQTTFTMPNSDVTITAKFKQAADPRIEVTGTQNSSGAYEKTAGDPVQINGSGFTPGETVTISLGTDGPELGTAEVGSDGRFTTEVTLPKDTKAGDYLLLAVDGASRSDAAFLAISADDSSDDSSDKPGATDTPQPNPSTSGSAKPGPGLAATGTDAAWLSILAALSLAAGTVMVYRSRSARRAKEGLSS